MKTRHSFIILSLVGLTVGIGTFRLSAQLTDGERTPARAQSAFTDLCAPKPGSAFTLPDLDVEMQPIPAGTFTMGTAKGGADAERPTREVTLSDPFWMGRTEVTQDQWETLMGNNPAHLKGGDRPVEHVSWGDAMKFCRKLNERENEAGRLPPGYTYSLPTEAQWEYACRAGTTSEFAGDLDEMAWYEANMNYETRSVGLKKPNAWGLYDMHGNLWELCLDWFALYPEGDVTDPTGPEAGTHRISRGGSWSAKAEHCGSAHRNRELPWNRNANLGFRLALTRTAFDWDSLDDDRR